MATPFTPPSSSFKELINRERERFVKPNWIVDSIKAGSLLPTHSYLLFPISQSPFSTTSTIEHTSIQSKTTSTSNISSSVMSNTRGLKEKNQEKDVSISTAVTAKDPNFIKNYFENSRLHYLSTWKSDFNFNLYEFIEEYFANERSSTHKEIPLSNKQKLRDMILRLSESRKKIMHVDMVLEIFQ